MRAGRLTRSWQGLRLGSQAVPAANCASRLGIGACPPVRLACSVSPVPKRGLTQREQHHGITFRTHRVLTRCTGYASCAKMCNEAPPPHQRTVLGDAKHRAAATGPSTCRTGTLWRTLRHTLCQGMAHLRHVATASRVNSVARGPRFDTMWFVKQNTCVLTR